MRIVKSFKRKSNSKKMDILSIASLSISTTNKLIYLLLTIIGVIIGVLAFYGYKTINDIETKMTQKIEEPLKIIESTKELSERTVDSLISILNEVKSVQKDVEIYSNLAKNSFSQSNEIFDSLKYRFEQSSKIEITIKSINQRLNQLNDNLQIQNQQLISLSNIFASVGVENQADLYGRERLLLYLLSFETDKLKPKEQQNPNIAFNLGRMWYLENNYLKALECFEQIKDKKAQLFDWAQRNFDIMYNDCIAKVDSTKH